MTPEDSSNSLGLEPRNATVSYALRLGEGLEFAEFEPSLWRLTVYHVLGVSRQVSLGYAEVFLLDYFAQHPGEMISRQQLLDHAWGDRVVSQGSLNQAISNLRSLLGDDQRREIILTVPRRGYQFNAEALVDWQEWLLRKQEIITPPQVDSQPRGNILPEAPIIVATPWQWQMPAVWCTVVVMSLTLLVGVFNHYYYAIFPPYASEQVTTGKLQVTLLAKDKEVLADTQRSLMPLFKRLDVLGGGRALIHRTNNFLEFTCFRADGTVHTLLVQMERMQLIEDANLQECLK